MVGRRLPIHTNDNCCRLSFCRLWLLWWVTSSVLLDDYIVSSFQTASKLSQKFISTRTVLPFNKLFFLVNDVDFQHKTNRMLFSTPRSDDSSGSNNSKNNNNNMDDELSKLIGKREQIKKNVKKRLEIVEENLQTSTEPVVDLDLDKLPEFKTQRPVRSNSKGVDDTNDNDDNDDDKVAGNNSRNSNNKKEKRSSTSASPIIDYMADYEDENEFHIPNRIGISTIGWGEKTHNFVVGKNVKLTKRQIKAGKFVAGDVQLAYQALLAAGITVFETSPLYGSSSRLDLMSAEHLLGQCIYQHPSDLPECRIITSSTYSAWKSIIYSGGLSLSKCLLNSLEQSLIRLSGPDAISNDDTSVQLSSIDLFAIVRSKFFPTSMLAASLASQIESGQANYIGVQEITSPRKLQKLCRILRDKYDTTLTSNMFEYSLTNTKNERLISICKDNGVIPLIRNPLDDGLASGIYTASNPSGGTGSGTGGIILGGQRTSTGGTSTSGTRKFTFRQLDKLQPLHSVQETVAERVRVRVSRSMGTTQERFKSKYGPPPIINTDITTTQIALQYIIAKGGVPLPACNAPSEAQEIIGCLGWTLTDDEVTMLDSAIALCKI